MTARERFASWLARCGTPVGGDNLIRVDGVLYAIDAHPRELGNGALVGRVHRHGATGFVDVGGFKIAGNGEVVQCPAEVAIALQQNSSEARKVSGIDHSPMPKDCALDDLKRPSAMNSGDSRERPASTQEAT